SQEISQENPLQQLAQEDSELASALALDIVPDTLATPEQPIQWQEMCTMLSKLIDLAMPEAADSWNTTAQAALAEESVMSRGEGMLAVYEAACTLGIGDKGRAYWRETDIYYSFQGLNDFFIRDDLFSNVHDASPHESNQGQVDGWDYITGGLFYAIGQSSPLEIKPLFSHQSDTVTYNDDLCAEEAIRAVYRLYLAWQSRTEGCFTIPETDWSDPALADAQKAKNAILNSPTTIQKGDEFILGETYSGTAYYVSNSGDDEQDGLSPETAWASLDKAASAALHYGDAVFFERGGVWSGRLIMQTGVTYSAYGEGEKPLITGSPLDAAQSEKWTFYGETEDGGKLWTYADQLGDCGTILLNDSLIARKAYPVWNGTDYATNEGDAFTVETGLNADLMFFSDLELSGYSLPVSVWTTGKSGTLYLRCDAGNPGEVFDTIELAVIPDATTTGEGGYNAIDNLAFRCYSNTGMDCNSHDNIVYQNCECCWCGGAVKQYDQGNNKIVTTISGGGLLLFGSDVTGRGNYIHDCENKGIAVVINGNGEGGDGHASLERTDVLIEGNLIERCGASIYMWTGLFAPDDVWKFENVVVRNNYVVNAAYGWRTHNQTWIGNGFGTPGTQGNAVLISDLQSTGEVLFEGNLFYCSAGPLICFEGNDFSDNANLPTMRGNTYVQSAEQLLYFCQDQSRSDEAAQSMLATENTALMEQCIKEWIGDTDGTVKDPAAANIK
ncbi:MAG: right-handed parallel beta-helix repeat-containing protein, partial [Roseburia sp.]|nr:right-handed parallel beta-helix repeat-containing protein [Roseburia sp.]